MNIELTCPRCRSVSDLREYIADASDRQAVEKLLTHVNPVLGHLLMDYIELHAPLKQRLTVTKTVRLLLQVLPAVSRGTIQHKGREWPAPPQAWARAIDYMLMQRAQDRIELPLTGHGYLLAVLAGYAEKQEAAAEAEREAERKSRAAAPRPVTYEVAGQPMPTAQAVAQVLGGQDPALAKLDADARRAVPIPPPGREQIARLKSPPPQPPQPQE